MSGSIRAASSPQRPSASHPTGHIFAQVRTSLDEELLDEPRKSTVLTVGETVAASTLVGRRAGLKIAWKEISGGRLVLGMGAGSRIEVFDAIEVPRRERGKRLHARIRYLHETPPGLRLWFGGRGDAVLRRVARSGSGDIGSSSSSVEGFVSRWRTLQQYVVETGREPSTVTPAALAHFSVDSDAARARQRMHAYLTHSYGPERAADWGR